MEWRTLLESRIKANRQILFSKEDEQIQSLMSLIQGMPRKAVVLWALELAEKTVKDLENKYPESNCARNALEMTKLWAQGTIKMPAAKRAILDCHAMAKRIEDKGDIARFHAVGQACGTVHTIGHAIGYPIYALTALIRENGLDDCEELVCSEMESYLQRLYYWNQYYGDESYHWASFIQGSENST